jgi:flagellar biosynthesis protein FlhG
VGLCQGRGIGAAGIGVATDLTRLRPRTFLGAERRAALGGVKFALTSTDFLFDGTVTYAQQTPRSPIVTVGGGKGGVGKSIIALNLAATLAQQGKRVVIADMDLGAANQHLLLGLSRTGPGLQALLDKSVVEARDCLIATPVPNLRLLAGTTAVLGAANITLGQKAFLLRKLRALEADIVIVDVGAGVGYNMLDFFDLGTRKLIVTTPQVTAIHDAYSFLKSAVLRFLHGNADKAIETALLEPATLSEGSEKVVEILAQLRRTRPDLADKVFAGLGRFGACLVGNQVTNSAQAGVFRAVARTIRDYLGLEVPVLACLRSSTAIHDSVNHRQPLALDPDSEDAAAFRGLAQSLLATLSDDDDLEIIEDEAFLEDFEAAPTPRPVPIAAVPSTPVTETPEDGAPSPPQAVLPTVVGHSPATRWS